MQAHPDEHGRCSGQPRRAGQCRHRGARAEEPDRDTAFGKGGPDGMQGQHMVLCGLAGQHNRVTCGRSGRVATYCAKAVVTAWVNRCSTSMPVPVRCQCSPAATSTGRSSTIPGGQCAVVLQRPENSLRHGRLVEPGRRSGKATNIGPLRERRAPRHPGRRAEDADSVGAAAGCQVPDAAASGRVGARHDGVAAFAVADRCPRRCTGDGRPHFAPMPSARTLNPTSGRSTAPPRGAPPPRRPSAVPPSDDGTVHAALVVIAASAWLENSVRPRPASGRPTVRSQRPHSGCGGRYVSGEQRRADMPPSTAIAGG